MIDGLASDRFVAGTDATRRERTEAGLVAARALYMLGSEAEQALTGSETIAWEGLLAVARHLRRGAEEMLVDNFDLTISMLGITGRLARAPERTLRQTALADAMDLSLSRVSRVIGLLEQRGLVQRHACPSDARATNVTLTRQGAALTARAQRRLFAYVQFAFFEHLDAREIETLAAAFTRLLNLPPSTAAEHGR